MIDLKSAIKALMRGEKIIRHDQAIAIMPIPAFLDSKGFGRRVHLQVGQHSISIQSHANDLRERIVIDLVHDIEQGRRDLSWDTFNILLDECTRLAQKEAA